jgi:F-type H+-transporting ATPase subunit delta
MATTVDTKAIAGTLYESLLNAALEQLRVASTGLAGQSGGDMTQRIEAALPEAAMPQVRNFLLGLAREDLLGHVDEIVEAFADYVSGGAPRELDAVITSAVALGDAQQQKIDDDLRARYGKDLKVSFVVDETLIGGLIIRVGDQVLDNSLRTRLSAVQRSMLTS